MLTADRAAEEVERFTERLESLYETVRGWASARFPGTTYTYGTVTRDEESTGVFTVRSMTVHIPGRPPLLLKPAALFNLGARGQVEVSGWFMPEAIFWFAGDESNEPGNETDEEEMLVSRPAYPNVPRGWVATDPRNNCVLPLTETVFWERAANEPELLYRNAQSA